MKITQIEINELNNIVETRTKAVESANIAEKAIKDARLAELEYKVQIQQLFLDKRLSPKCNIDMNTGKVSWPAEESYNTVEEIVCQTTNEAVDVCKTTNEAVEQTIESTEEKIGE